MLVVLDSNIFLSALISPGGPPHRIYKGWLEGRFTVLTCPEQLEELRRASRYPKFRGILQPHLTGLMLNHLQHARVLERVPKTHSADDPEDAYLLNLADAGGADYLVTGDKRAGLLQRKRVGRAQIVMATIFAKQALGE